ncbi:chloride channel CLIC-like protein 1 isoform X1 [Mastacembelus armatus]|uniref:chloride channel CLIC-like protein 1 isoform X1 n=1 Tax=Mastacembelus armatus TaxID=205130 RepID=UPI000E46102A|nr:chloride channel CLIC-like protein 1 isoform X1 [Mastacembelus armatus]
MLLVVLVQSLALAALGQEVGNDWVDPYDMLNYDASTKSMRKPTETVNYNNVGTKRRQYTQDSSPPELESCSSQVADLQRLIEEKEKKIVLISQQPTCNPVFKRFLSRLMKEIEKNGLPSHSSDGFYDATIRLSKQAMTEIQTLLEGEDSWRTGALDNAISEILVNLRKHDYEAWKWRFEDTFGVELDTLLKMGLFVLVTVAIICTELWSKVSWFMQFKRMFAVSFFISIVWNWFYLYKIAFAEHQNNIVKMNSLYEKCTGIKKIDWSDSLKEWFRSTWTLQDDPCQKYHEVLVVNPFLLVPPTKAISVTITTFITEPLKHLGQGISEFLRALLKDLPVTLQIPVLLTIVLAIVVFMYGSVQAAFQHGITAPFRRPRRDPHPPELEQPQPQLQRIGDGDHLAAGDAPQLGQIHQAHNERLQRNQVHQRRSNRPREEPARMVVETLRTADPAYSEDEVDTARHEVEQNLSNSENKQETQEELAEVQASSVATNTDQTKAKPTELDSNQSKDKPLNEKHSEDQPSEDSVAPRSQPERTRHSQTDVQTLVASVEDKTSSTLAPCLETVGFPVQETRPAE